jgi:hypothetical protein
MRGKAGRGEAPRYPALPRGGNNGSLFPTPPRTWPDSFVDSFDLSLLQDNEEGVAVSIRDKELSLIFKHRENSGLSAATRQSNWQPIRSILFDGWRPGLFQYRRGSTR